MQNSCLPAAAAGFLAARGEADLAGGFREKLPALVRFFRENAPSSEAAPLSPARLEYLTALLSCLSAMDEQLYEHYRALADLFRDQVFRLPREELLADSAWDSLRKEAVALRFLSEELYGETPSRPRIGVPEIYGRICGEGIA